MTTVDTLLEEAKNRLEEMGKAEAQRTIKKLIGVSRIYKDALEKITQRGYKMLPRGEEQCAEDALARGNEFCRENK